MAERSNGKSDRVGQRGDLNLHSLIFVIFIVTLIVQTCCLVLYLFEWVAPVF